MSLDEAGRERQAPVYGSPGHKWELAAFERQTRKSVKSRAVDVAVFPPSFPPVDDQGNKDA